MISSAVRSPEPTVRTLLSVALLVALAIPAANALAANDSETGRAEPAATKVETDTYIAEISASGPSKPGETSTVRVTLTTKGGYHINAQFPYRFKATVPTEGVTYPKPVLERADGQFEEKKASFNLPFVAGHAGKVEVGGIFHLSVCSPTNCIVQKAPLAVSIDVK